MVLDVFSQFGWTEPLKDKKGEPVTQEFKTVFKESRKLNIYELIKERILQ